jgi:hypothetical protein
METGTVRMLQCAGGEAKRDEGLVSVDPRSTGAQMVRMRSSPALLKLPAAYSRFNRSFPLRRE